MPGLCVVREEMGVGEADPVPVVAEFTGQDQLGEGVPSSRCNTRYRAERAESSPSWALWGREYPKQPFLVALTDSIGH